MAIALFAINPFPTSALAEFSPDAIQTGNLGTNEDKNTADLPAGLTVVDWAQIRREYEFHRHSAVPDGDGFKARNHNQDWLIRFDGHGFSVQPDEDGWEWGLELVSYGFEGAERAVGDEAAITVDKNRLSYAWDETVEEWFINGTRGLEHGFTLHRRPDGERERLLLRLAVRGGLRAQTVDAHAVRFVNEAEESVVNYAGLKVWDADGRTLPARLHVTTANEVQVVVDDRGAAYPITVDPIAQQAYLKASNTDAHDNFGYTVAVSGDTVVVGADFEDSNGVGVNPPSQADNSADGSGAAYVFVRTAGVWSQQAYLKASNTGADDRFGFSVAVWGDTLVVSAIRESSNGAGVNPLSQADNSATSSGAAYVFVRTAGVWSQQAYLKASNTDERDRFGFSVAIWGDTVVVGARSEDSNGVGVNPPSQADNSLDQSGAAYVFVRTAGVWSQQAYLKASNTDANDTFGGTVAVWGDTVVVGAIREDSNGVGVNPPSQADNSEPLAGAAYVFVRTAGVWSQQAYLKASNTDASDRFGFSVAVWGDTVVAGAELESSNGVGVNPLSQADNSLSESGAAYVFAGLGPPVADAGPDQLLYVPGSGTADVTLDGSGSINPVGSPLIYTWTGPFPEGGGTVMGEMPMVTLPPGVHTVTLTVDDGNLMDTDTVEITVLETTMADAGPDQLHQVPSGGTAAVTLDGSGSSDLDMDMLTFTWTGPFPEGGGTIMGVMPMVTLPEGTHNITLTVDDGNGGMDSDTVQIEVVQAGTCPADLVIENVLLPGTQTLEATATVTLGPNLIVNGTNIVVNAPVVTINAGTQIGGTFTIGTTPSCP